MNRKIFFFFFQGILAGIALNQLLNLLFSYGLHLGYYAPCLVSLPEMLGGELNAALFQTMLAGIIGGAAGTLTSIRVSANIKYKWKGSRHHEHRSVSA